MEEKSLTLKQEEEKVNRVSLNEHTAQGYVEQKALGSSDYTPPPSIAPHPHPIKLAVQMPLEEPPRAGEMAWLEKCLPHKCGN